LKISNFGLQFGPPVGRGLELDRKKRRQDQEEVVHDENKLTTNLTIIHDIFDKCSFSVIQEKLSSS
jgi:hypothetical protein